MNCTKSIVFILALVLLCSFTMNAAAAKKHTVIQADKTFQIDGSRVRSIEIKKGDTVRFKNEDRVFHNIISFSKVKKFNTGAYGKGKSESVTFNKKGTVDVECAIHPRMRMEIIIE